MDHSPAGRVLNVVKEGGRDVAIRECAQGHPAHLYLANDLTIAQLAPTRAEMGRSLRPNLTCSTQPRKEHTYDQLHPSAMAHKIG